MQLTFGRPYGRNAVLWSVLLGVCSSAASAETGFPQRPCVEPMVAGRYTHDEAKAACAAFKPAGHMQVRACHALSKPTTVADSAWGTYETAWKNVSTGRLQSKTFSWICKLAPPTP